MDRPAAVSIEEALIRLPLWRAAEGRAAIARGFRFKDFAAAMAFMNAIAAKAEAMDHHPEWTNVYNRVDVLLTTHDAGGVTELDIALAEAMDAAVSSR